MLVLNNVKIIIINKCFCKLCIITYRFNTEKEVRISTDDTKTKLWEENERLRKERDAANNDLHRYIKQKEETEKILDEKRSAYTSEPDKVQKEKNKLIAMLKDNQEADTEKVQRLEREIVALRTRSVFLSLD